MPPTKGQLRLVSAILFFASSTIFQTVAAPAKSEWVYPGPNGKLVYKTTPAGDKIMDFSSAGYMGGGVALPTIPIKLTVKPSGTGDDTAIIQAAIDRVGTMPLQDGFRGAVLLAPGTFVCSNTIYLSTNGVVLRGSGSGTNGSTLQMTGGRHVAIATGNRRGRVYRPAIEEEDLPEPGQSAAAGRALTFIADPYVPSGAISFTVAKQTASGSAIPALSANRQPTASIVVPTGLADFAVGDTIEIRRPVTAEWVKFMGMDNLTRDGKPQTWIRVGTVLPIERRIVAISSNRITLDVPLSDSINSKFFNPPGTPVAKVRTPARLNQLGIEHLHIESPPQQVNHIQELYTALRINGEDCWVRDVVIDETMNSVSIGGRRITLENVTVNRKALHLGASKPAEFAPNGDQILLNRCSVNADNVWFGATGAGHSGPIVFLNCTFAGNGRIEGHMRWTTGMLLDNCSLPEGGIDFKNRGAMGSGHGWGMGWAVAWNCVAKSYVIQCPPGAFNWAIGCIGARELMSRPFDTSPTLAEGTFDSYEKPVGPQSLYLAQLAERLGLQSLKNIGYSSPEIKPAERAVQTPWRPLADEDKTLGSNLALLVPVNTSNVRESKHEFSGEMAVDGDDKTYWAASDGVTNASLELDMPGPTAINTVVLEEPSNLTGQVQEYKVEAQVDSDWKLLAKGTSIGQHKVDRFPKVTAWKVRLTILKSAPYPAIRKFGLYLDKISPPENFKFPIANASNN